VDIYIYIYTVIKPLLASHPKISFDFRTKEMTTSCKIPKLILFESN
jgi:hypothetical protein